MKILTQMLKSESTLVTLSNVAIFLGAIVALMAVKS